MKKIICMLLLGLGSTASWSAEQTWCVFDPLNAQGEIGHSLEDIRLFALQQQVKIKIKIYGNQYLLAESDELAKLSKRVKRS